MKIDILIPCYRGVPHPRMKEALDKAIAFSACRCCLNEAQAARDLWEAVKSKRPVKLAGNNPFHAPDQCPNGKHDIVVAPQVNFCVIHWCRNELVKVARKDADYVLFIDDDIVIEPDAIERMLAHGKDIVAGTCTRRVDPPEPVHRRWMDEIQNYGMIYRWQHDGRLLEVDAVGTGLMLISRRVLEHMAVAYYPKQFSETQNGWWFELVRGPHGEEWGEDISFCFKATRLGYRIFVDTSITPSHMGDYNYSIDDYLQYQKEVIDAGGMDSYRKQVREAPLQQLERPVPREVVDVGSGVQVLDLATR